MGGCESPFKAAEKLKKKAEKKSSWALQSEQMVGGRQRAQNTVGERQEKGVRRRKRKRKPRKRRTQECQGEKFEEREREASPHICISCCQQRNV